ncbi:hypothetical protein H6F76_10025 [Leptolyngbya sp. FACHB-321]|uniref:hypothetical protein n=1 Tax=Leptolyngbya sp. FACHB-321 TaxID=2692807 RepID=UPI001688E727|nr:hypothetical protein [Leptolyngbya sp. FACHB-321]MBD2035359.1 hypothetical protein [Leptolyngbya sp. FACHB-321]
MAKREQLIQEIEQVSDDLVQPVLDFLHRLKAVRQEHPLAKFVGILSDAEAEGTTVNYCNRLPTG